MSTDKHYRCIWSHCCKIRQDVLDEKEEKEKKEEGKKEEGQGEASDMGRKAKGDHKWVLDVVSAAIRRNDGISLV